jgi:pimeloyl-ACP methyl ester carboxylesterase
MQIHLLVPLLATALVAALVALPSHVAAAESRPGLKPCRLKGVEHDALCGVLSRPLNPAEPGGKQVDIHYAVLPALARNRKADPVFFFAGGPGQSAMDVGGTVSRILARLGSRRDVVLVDQRGTGRSAPLVCDEPPAAAPLAEAMDPARQLAQLQACRSQLQALPYGDLRYFTTTIAMQDADAVRQALGAEQIDIVGGSYGTRAVLEYQRLFPKAVRRAVLDGVAPPDMALPAAMSTDNQAALDLLLAACRADPACALRHPALAEDWRALLARLPLQARVQHPLTGAVESVTVTREFVLGQVRLPLYVPALAAALPLAVSEAAQGRFEALVGLGAAMGSRGAGRMAGGMHFSVVCAEDLPRLAQSADLPGRDFGKAAADLYERVCASWPRGEVPAAFYSVPAAPAATLMLSNGADPVTPPRHGERVAGALGAKARHVVVPQAGHGVMSLPCMRDVLFRFIDAATDADALAVDATCAAGVPRPALFVPPGLPASGARP